LPRLIGRALAGVSSRFRGDAALLRADLGGPQRSHALRQVAIHPSTSLAGAAVDYLLLAFPRMTLG
jgi:hypothetical protein